MLTRVEQIKPLHTETCNLACTDLLMNPDRMPKLGQSDLPYGSKSPAEKVGVNSSFQATW